MKIKFQGKRADSIQFRPGYFSLDPKKERDARGPLDDAVLSAKSLNDVPAVVAVTAQAGKDGAIPVSIAVTLDLNRLQFTKFEGRHMQQIVFLMTLLDANGEFVSGKASIMDLALTDDKLASLKRDGLKAVATLNAPPGRYQVRTVVREGMKGSLTASTTQVELGASNAAPCCQLKARGASRSLPGGHPLKLPPHPIQPGCRDANLMRSPSASIQHSWLGMGNRADLMVRWSR